MAAASCGSFDPHNETLAAGATKIIVLPSGVITSGVVNEAVTKYVPADGVVISCVGSTGDYAGIRIDSDTASFFRIPTGALIEINVPVKKQIELKNESDGSVDVSVAFLRGRNKR